VIPARTVRSARKLPSVGARGEIAWSLLENWKRTVHGPAHSRRRCLGEVLAHVFAPATRVVAYRMTFFVDRFGVRLPGRRGKHGPAAGADPHSWSSHAHELTIRYRSSRGRDLHRWGVQGQSRAWRVGCLAAQWEP
jgi:hypothetical protein